jgi:hypothetical protein
MVGATDQGGGKRWRSMTRLSSTRGTPKFLHKANAVIDRADSKCERAIAPDRQVAMPPPMPAAPSLAEHIAERLAAHQNAFKEELQLLRNARGDRAIDQALAQFREEELRQAVEARTGMQARPRRAPLP